MRKYIKTFNENFTNDEIELPSRGGKIEIDESLLDCILAVINPDVANKSDLYFSDTEAKQHLYDFFKNEAKGWYSDDFIDKVFNV